MVDFGFEKRRARSALKTVEDVQALLQREIISCSEFEGRMLKELRYIEDLESNLKIINGQLEMVKKLASEREKIILNLMAEASKKDVEVNIVTCRNYISMIGRISAELSPMIEKMISELARLILQDTHELYKESDENRKAMSDVDKTARIVNAEVRRIKEQVDSGDAHVIGIGQRMEQFEAERALRTDRKPGKMGF